MFNCCWGFFSFFLVGLNLDNLKTKNEDGIYLKGKDEFKLDAIDAFCNTYVVIYDNSYWTFAV